MLTSGRSGGEFSRFSAGTRPLTADPLPGAGDEADRVAERRNGVPDRAARHR